MYGVLTNAPYVERATALQWNFSGDALGILHYVEVDSEALTARMDELSVVRDYEIASDGDGAFYLYVHDATTDSLQELFGPLSGSALVVVPPIQYHADGTVTMSLFGSAEDLQSAVDSIPDPIDVEIESVGGLVGATPAADGLLSERQREAVEVALKLGYYAVPREAGHEAVAEAMDCAPSTAAEHLRKAESKVLRSLFGSD
jgi:hypothetical protein